MKALVVIAESNVAPHAAAVDKAMQSVRDAQQHLDGAEARAQTARDALSRAKLDLGRALHAARACWPTRGPRAKGWSDFLAVRRLTLDAAQEAMRYAGFVDGEFGGDVPDKLPTRREAGLDTRPLAGDDDQTGPRIVPDPKPAAPAPFRALSESDIIQALARLDPEAQKRILRAGKANVAGGSGEVERGNWCTPKALALAVGPWDVDPFSNPRSHVAAVDRCTLEDGGDGFGDGGGYGRYRVRSRDVQEAEAHTRVWIQPKYEQVLDAIEHYGHTRFCALLRWAPDTKWFSRLWPLVHAVAFPRGERIEFEPPEGIEASSNPYPHALYYADERDVTDEVRATCLVWRIDHDEVPQLVNDPAHDEAEAESAAEIDPFGNQ